MGDIVMDNDQTTNADLLRELRRELERAVQQARADLLAAARGMIDDARGEIEEETRFGGRLPQRTQETPRGVPFVSWCTWGCVYGANQAKLYNCRARRLGEYNVDGTIKVYTCADKTITFTGDGTEQRIVWRWNPDAGLTIEDNPQVNDPQDSSGYISGVVAMFDRTNGVITPSAGGTDQLGHLLWLPVFAPATV